MGVVSVTFSFTGFSGLEEFFVTSGKDGLFFTGEFLSWGDEADRGVKPHGVVVFDEASDQATGLLENTDAGPLSLSRLGMLSASWK